MAVHKMCDQNFINLLKIDPMFWQPNKIVHQNFAACDNKLFILSIGSARILSRKNILYRSALNINLPKINDQQGYCALVRSSN